MHCGRTSCMTDATHRIVVNSNARGETETHYFCEGHALERISGLEDRSTIEIIPALEYPHP